MSNSASDRFAATSAPQPSHRRRALVFAALGLAIIAFTRLGSPADASTDQDTRMVPGADASTAAIHQQQDDANDVMISDSQRQDGDLVALGTHPDATVHNALPKHVTLHANPEPASGPYWTGDGFAAEDGTYSTRFDDTKRRFRFWGRAVIISSRP